MKFIIIYMLILLLSQAQQLLSTPFAQVYVVYLGEHILRGEKTSEEQIEEVHQSYLESVKGSRSKAQSSMVYSYKNVINGFSAVLTPQEAAVLSGMEGVVSVIHNHPKAFGLHTTRSWDFTSLLEGGGTPNNGYEDLLLKAQQGKDIIVGVIDTGIWPESESFNDKGMEPVPTSWNGICQTGTGFNSSHCNSSVSSDGVARAGGAGAILINSYNGTQIQQVSHIIPAIIVSEEDGRKIIGYARNATNPMATLIPGTTILGTKPAPVMAPFTSVGPNLIDFNLLKPDITAPGMNILAAWSEGISPTKLDDDPRIAKYNMISGTSMSCPHVAAAAALLRAIHPDWSSAAIRSALMTTAGVVNNVGTGITDANEKQANPFQFGSGHFNPSKAVHPGLVYDATYTEYLIYLCQNGYKIDTTFTCPTNVSPSSNSLNYPSLAISNLTGPVTVLRTVTNVGNALSVYNVTWRAPAGYSVAVSPPTLYFNMIGEKKSFYVTVLINTATTTTSGSGFSFGWYRWSDGIHFVTSPIAVSSA